MVPTELSPSLHTHKRCLSHLSRPRPAVVRHGGGVSAGDVDVDSDFPVRAHQAYKRKADCAPGLGGYNNRRVEVEAEYSIAAVAGAAGTVHALEARADQFCRMYFGGRGIVRTYFSI